MKKIFLISFFIFFHIQGLDFIKIFTPTLILCDESFQEYLEMYFDDQIKTSNENISSFFNSTSDLYEQLLKNSLAYEIVIFNFDKKKIDKDDFFYFLTKGISNQFIFPTYKDNNNKDLFDIFCESDDLEEEYELIIELDINNKSIKNIITSSIYKQENFCIEDFNLEYSNAHNFKHNWLKNITDISQYNVGNNLKVLYYLEDKRKFIILNILLIHKKLSFLQRITNLLR